MNAVLWYRVVDPARVVTTVMYWDSAVIQAAETSLRDAIGQSDLDQLLKDRVAINARLLELLRQGELDAAIMALPLMVRSIRLSLEAIDPRLEQAARTLGAGRLDRFFTIVLPLARPGVLAALVLGFARSLGEFGATITFVSNVPGETATLPLAIYSALQVPGAEATVWRLALVSVVLSLGALIASEWLVRRRLSRDHIIPGHDSHVL